MSKKRDGILISLVRQLYRIFSIGWVVLTRPTHAFITELHLRVFSYNTKPNKKILGVWDFNNVGGKLGDFMNFLALLSVLRIKYNLVSKKNPDKKNIDICFIDDEKHHNAKLTDISKQYFWKKMLISLVVTNPYISGVYHFDSNKEFNRFFIQNKSRYFRWPATTFPFNMPIGFKYIEDFFKKNQYIPHLSIPNQINLEINEFYKKNIFPAFPIVLNIRNNKTRNDEKNSNIKELKKFISFYSDKQFKFIVICNKWEIPKELVGLKNVIFSKHYFDDIVYDLALINNSYASIFPSSGMSVFAFFSDIPFIMYGKHSKMYNPYSAPYRGRNPVFFKRHQHFFPKNENSVWLKKEFNDLLNYIKKNNIQKDFWSKRSKIGEKIF